MFKSEQLADNVWIYNGDCRHVIPTLTRIDAVVSDPPYGISDLVEGYGRQQLTVEGTWGYNHDRNIANDNNLDVVTEVLNVIKSKFDNIWLALFYSCRISPTFFQATNMLDYVGERIWDKKMVGLGAMIRYQHENVAYFKLGNPATKLESCISMIPFTALKGEVRSVHPHEKPTQVMQEICSCVPGKIILDPFMGTGTTGAACVQLKRGFIGIELEEKYYKLAKTKIKAALAQPVSFWE